MIAKYFSEKDKIHTLDCFQISHIFKISHLKNYIKLTNKSIPPIYIAKNHCIITALYRKGHKIAAVHLYSKNTSENCTPKQTATASSFNYIELSNQQMADIVAFSQIQHKEDISREQAHVVEEELHCGQCDELFFD